MATKNMRRRLSLRRRISARFVEELKALLRIPSVSTLPEHVGDVRRGGRICGGGAEADWDGECSAD